MEIESLRPHPSPNKSTTVGNRVLLASSLNSFVGSWKVSSETVIGHETFRWLEGGFFLEYRWQRQFDGTQRKGMGLIGYDSLNRRHFANFFDDLGFARFYDAFFSENVLQLQGVYERGSLTLDHEHCTLRVFWENTVNGIDWSPLCDLKGTRQPLA